MLKTKLILPVLFLVFAIQPVVAQTDSLSANETTFILVRHAEKADDGTSDPALNEIGMKRAESLSNWLNEHYKIAAIYSTAYQRTKMTAAATANSNKLPVNEYDFKDTQGFLKGLVESNKGKTVLIVGHSNTTPMFANVLLGRKEFENLSEDVYDQIYIIKTESFGKGTVDLFTY